MSPKISDESYHFSIKKIMNLQIHQYMHSRFTLTFILMEVILFTANCTNIGRGTQTINPEEVNKDDLKNIPYEVTPEYEFKVSVAKNVPSNKNNILLNIDRQFTEFSRCYDLEDNGGEARKYMIAVVDGTFECKFHGGKCNGEFDPGAGLIIASFKAFNRKGTLPLLKHEWAHAYGILSSDHENLKSVKKCTRY